MKGLNFCLDYLLRHLRGNRLKTTETREPFDVDHVVLPNLKLTNHEEFIGLIDILIEDGYAIKITEPMMERLDYYKSRILITPKGLHFINNGGYARRRFWDIVKKTAAALNIVALLIIGVLQWMASVQDNPIKQPEKATRRDNPNSKQREISPRAIDSLQKSLTIDSINSKK
jgi:hypothetical protein